jgi:hypothetical protein
VRLATRRQRLAALRRRYTEERIAAHVALLGFTFAQDSPAAARRGALSLRSCGRGGTPGPMSTSGPAALSFQS